LERKEALTQSEIRQKHDEVLSRERIKMKELELEQRRLARKTETEKANDSDGANSHGSAANTLRQGRSKTSVLR